MQQAILTLPDGIAAAIRNDLSVSLERRLLELSAIQAHESDLLTEREVMEMLGFQDKEELYEFFKRHDVRSKYTTEDFEKEGAALETLLARNGK